MGYTAVTVSMGVVECLHLAVILLGLMCCRRLSPVVVHVRSCFLPFFDPLVRSADRFLCATASATDDSCRGEDASKLKGGL